MRRPLAAPLATILGLTLSSGVLLGCEMIKKGKGLYALMTEIDEHLDEDLAAPLTDERIDMFIEVAPKLDAFVEESENKWRPDPKKSDIRQMVQGLGAVAEYMAFFETHDTRLTEFYVVMLKVYDARASIAIEEGSGDVREQLEKDKAEAIAKKATASEEEKKELDEAIERADKALEKLDEVKAESERADAQTPEAERPYTMTEEEIELVRARKDEIDKAFKDGGYEAQFADKE